MTLVEKQGAVIAAYDRSRKHAPPEHCEKRGEVTGFSKKSRRRLFILLNRLQFVEGKTTFLTLTFEGSPLRSDVVAAWKRWRQRMMRYFPEMSAVWRIEMQRRGVAHFHVLLFNMPFVPWWWMKDQWTECCGAANTRIWMNRIKSRKHALSYVAKYIAKVDADGAVSPLLDLDPYWHKTNSWAGRAWGWINDKALPYAEQSWIEVDDWQLMRYFWSTARAKTKGKCGHSNDMTMIFSDEAEAMFEFIRQHAERWRYIDSDEVRYYAQQ